MNPKYANKSDYVKRWNNSKSHQAQVKPYDIERDPLYKEARKQAVKDGCSHREYLSNLFQLIKMNPIRQENFGTYENLYSYATENQ